MQTSSRRASSAHPVAERLSRFDVARLIRIALFAAASFAVAYLVAANVILRTRFLRDLVSEASDVELDYASAYSVWPGLVHVRDLEIAVQDSKVQFSIAADSAVVMVSLHDLSFKRFHATHAALEGLAFRFRPKVEPNEATRPHVVAYPPIDGFPDPAIHTPGKPRPSGAEHDLWQVAIDDVEAELRELWMFEYRYVGPGSVRGGFRLYPEQTLAVYPAAVELQRGLLSVGDELCAERLSLELEGSVEATDLRQVKGAALAEKMTGRLRLGAEGLELAALDVRAEPGSPWRLAGNGRLDVSAAMTRGRLDAESSAQFDAPASSLRSPFGKLAGAVSSSLRVGIDGRIDWVTTSPRLSLTNSSPHQGPVIGGPRLALTLHAETLASAPSLRAVELDVPRLTVPSLGWAERWLKRSGAPFQVAGRLDGRGHFSFVPARGPRARLQLRLAGAELTAERIRAGLGGRIELELEPARADSPSSRGQLEIELDGVEVERVRERTKPFRAAVRLPDLKLALGPEPALSAGVDVFATPVNSLLSLALGSSMLEELAADVLSLRRLEAHARLAVSRRSVQVELARAESGALTGAGFWQRPAAGDAHGAFLISSGVANVGISLVGSDTETDWFVSKDWLSSRGRDEPPRAAAAQGASARRRR